MHNLQEFEKVDDASDKIFEENEMDTSKHAKLDQVNELNPKPSTRPLHKKRLPGQGQSIDDDNISYYNRYYKSQDLPDRRMI